MTHVKNESNVTDVQIFKNDQFGQIRTSGTSELPLFCLSDLCNSLSIANNRNVRQRLDNDDVRQVDIIDNLGRNQIATYVTESGMYDVIIRSDSPKAKPFRKWITSEVLPTIRRTGGYMVSAPEETPEQIMARALLVANDTIERNKKKMAQLQQRVNDQESMLESRDKHLQQMIPSVRFANAVKTSEHSILVGELATIIKQNGVEIGQNRLFAWLRKNGFLLATTERYNLPTQKAMNMGLFEIKKTTITKPDGTTLVTATPKVTGKGQIYFVNRFLYEEANRQGAEFQKNLEAERKGGSL